MTPATRPLLVALAAVLGPPARAADPPPATPDHARRAALLAAGYTAVPLVHHTFGPGGGATLLAVECRVGTETAKFVLNTEPGNSYLDEKLAKRLKLESGEAKRADGKIARTADLGGIVIGGYDTRRDFETLGAVVGDQAALGGVGGVLGRSVLDAYAAVIDCPARTLYLRPPLRTAWPKLAGKWEVTGRREDGAEVKLDPTRLRAVEFADRRLRMTVGDKTEESAVNLFPGGDGSYAMGLFDPKTADKPVYEDVWLLKASGGKMTVCFIADAEKAKGQPPTEFAAPKGSGYALLELKHTAPDTLKPAADPLRDLLVKGGFAAVKLDRGPTGERTVVGRVGDADTRFVLHTGTSVGLFDTAALKRWGAEPVGDKVAVEPAPGVKADVVYFRGLRFGGYDTRSSMSVVLGVRDDLTAANKDRKDAGWPVIDGFLGLAELRNGAAVIDLHHDTLYLRPVKAELWPRLEGKWVGVSVVSDGRKGRQRDAARTTLEFKDGRVRFSAPGLEADWAAHVQDEGRQYRLAFFDREVKQTDVNFGYTGGGIFKLSDAGRLTLNLFTDPSKRGEAVYTFDAPEGSGRVLIEFERAK